MKSTRNVSRLTVIILIAAILSAGCVNREVTPSVTVTYAPPLLPIEITYDVLSGQLKVALSGRIQTPLGSFKVSFAAASIAKRYNGVRTLTLITGDRKVVYELEHGRPYSIKLPSDENGETEVRYSGNDENLEISIPNPTDETIAELKEKLREEQEAHGEGDGSAVATDSPESETPAAETQPLLTPSPTPQAQRVLTLKECQELVAQYVPGQFLYVPSECQDMFRAYQAYLQQQEYESRRKQEQEAADARRKQEQADYEREQQEELRRRKEEADAQRREQKIRQWTNVIDEILRSRRRRL
jgi:hypothetical protein